MKRGPSTAVGYRVWVKALLNFDRMQTDGAIH
jgi:hypothetical protein